MADKDKSVAELREQVREERRRRQEAERLAKAREEVIREREARRLERDLEGVKEERGERREKVKSKEGDRAEAMKWLDSLAQGIRASRGGEVKVPYDAGRPMATGRNIVEGDSPMRSEFRGSREVKPMSEPLVISEPLDEMVMDPMVFDTEAEYTAKPDVVRGAPAEITMEPDVVRSADEITMPPDYLRGKPVQPTSAPLPVPTSEPLPSPAEITMPPDILQRPTSEPLGGAVSAAGLEGYAPPDVSGGPQVSVGEAQDVQAIPSPQGGQPQPTRATPLGEHVSDSVAHSAGDAVLPGGVEATVVPGQRPEPVPFDPQTAQAAAFNATEQAFRVQSLEAAYGDEYTPDELAKIAQDPRETELALRIANDVDARDQLIRAKNDADLQFADDKESIALRRAELGAQRAKQYKADIDKLQNMRVDEDRMWNNAGVGRQLGMSLAIALGTLANPDGPNVVFNAIDNAVQKDIRAQERQIDMQFKMTGMRQKFFDMAVNQLDDREMAALATKQKAYTKIQADFAEAQLKYPHKAQALEAYKAEAQQRAMEARLKLEERLGEVAATKAKTALDKAKAMKEFEEARALAAKTDRRGMGGAGGSQKSQVVNPLRVFNVTGPGGQNFLEFGEKGIVDARGLNEKLTSASSVTAAAQRILNRGIERDIPGAELRVLNDADASTIGLAFQALIKGNPSDKDMKLASDRYKTDKSLGAVLSLASPETRRKLLETLIAVTEADANRALSGYGRDPETGRQLYFFQPPELSPDEDPARRDPSAATPPLAKAAQVSSRVQAAESKGQLKERSDSFIAAYKTGKLQPNPSSEEELRESAANEFDPIIERLRVEANESGTPAEMKKQLLDRLRRVELMKERYLESGIKYLKDTGNLRPSGPGTRVQPLKPSGGRVF